MSRKIPPNSVSITGSLPTFYPAQQLHYESKLERDFLILLEIDKKLEAVVTQPMTLNLSVEGRLRTYTPDILATWWDDTGWPYGTKQVVFEVKPYDVLKRDFAKLAPKYRAARNLLASQGLGFRVVTNRSIYTPRQANAALLVGPMQRPVPQSDVVAVQKIMLSNRADRTFGDVHRLLVEKGLYRNVARDTLYHLLGTGFLVADLSLLLNDSTPMRWWSIVALEEAANEAGSL